MKPSISIDERSKEPIYRQIMQGVRHLVATGQLVAGDELPSLRQLAVDLNVHLNTVALAYRELERQGIVRLRQGSRATILSVDRASLVPDPQVHTLLREQLERLRTEAILAGVPLAEVRELAMEVLQEDAEGG
ncbi:MAG: GntR family transcriptional regulator [Ktedonobacterales bacterium]|nr:GntR family transcriptional regulator [Ktedonobacterales bacterium]